MAYKVIILYQLYMPSYFLGTFTEYPYIILQVSTVISCSGIMSNKEIPGPSEKHCFYPLSYLQPAIPSLLPVLVQQPIIRQLPNRIWNYSSLFAALTCYV